MHLQVCTHTTRHVQTKPVTSSDTEANLRAAEREKLRHTQTQDEGAARCSRWKPFTRGLEEQAVCSIEKKTVNLEFYSQQNTFCRKGFAGIEKLQEFTAGRPTLQEMLGRQADAASPCHLLLRPSQNTTV